MRNSTIYAIAGPKTFRLGSKQILSRKVLVDGKVKTKGWGSNLQNIEKSMREIYIPDEGKVLVQPDQSGADALIVAFCCKPGNYRDLFLNSIKPHSYLGMHLFKEKWPNKMAEYGFGGDDFHIEELIECPIRELKNHRYWQNLDRLIKDSDNWSVKERYYFLAKQTEHSSNYLVGANMFRMNTLEKSGGKVVIGKDEAEIFLATKFAIFPEISGYHRWVETTARTCRMLYNLQGHPYAITHYEILDTHLKELYSWIPQSTVGEITNIAFTNMYRFIETNKLKWDLLQNNHDSYLLQAPIGEEFECGEQARRFIEQSFISPIDEAKFNMRSEVQYGFNWSPAKKKLDGSWSNYEGLMDEKNHRERMLTWSK